EDGYVLRRVPLAMLREFSRPNTEGGLRTAALRALTVDGDSDALAQLEAGAAAGNVGQLGVLAQSSDRAARDQAVAGLVKAAKDPNLKDKQQVIKALGGSRSAAAVQPLIDLLKDPDPYTRGEAALALADLGARQTIESIKPLLDQMSPVKM